MDLQERGVYSSYTSAAINNARRFLEVQNERGSFDAYLWDFVDGVPQQHTWRSMAEVPATAPAADALSRDLSRRGFKFVGPTICYALMQAIGMVNDHLVDCFRRSQITAGHK